MVTFGISALLTTNNHIEENTKIVRLVVNVREVHLMYTCAEESGENTGVCASYPM